MLGGFEPPTPGTLESPLASLQFLGMEEEEEEKNRRRRRKKRKTEERKEEEGIEPP